MFDFIWSLKWNDNRPSLCRKWIVVDCLFISILSLLRIPRLNYSKATVALLILSFLFLDGLMFGGISLNVGFPKSSRTMQSGQSGTVAYHLSVFTLTYTFQGLLNLLRTQNASLSSMSSPLSASDLFKAPMVIESSISSVNTQFVCHQ